MRGFNPLLWEVHKLTFSRHLFGNVSHELPQKISNGIKICQGLHRYRSNKPFLWIPSVPVTIIGDMVLSMKSLSYLLAGNDSIAESESVESR